MNTAPSKLKIMGGALIVAGTAIGAGMLGLPLVSAEGGFLPSICIYLLCYLFSVATGLLFLEICLWMPQDANIISMAQHLLGRGGKYCAWVLYLFLFYLLTIAYVSAGGDFFVSLFDEKIPHFVGVILFTCIFGAIVYMGTNVVDRINWFLIAGMVITFFLFVIFGIGNVNLQYLSTVNWPLSLFALPVVFTSFSYQGVIPSLNTYLERNAASMRKVIFIGTAIPFVSYIIWEFLILGIVPLEGPHGLLEAKMQGSDAILPLKYYVMHKGVYSIGQFFAAFALTTSFLGVTLGLFDFLSDGLQIPKIGVKKLFLAALIYVPPIIITIINPGIFLIALGYAGGIGCALLLGLLPVLMVWRGRYYMHYPKLHRQLPGGRSLLSLLALFVLGELCIQLFQGLMR